jgi:hypothetical protein
MFEKKSLKEFNHTFLGPLLDRAWAKGWIEPNSKKKCSVSLLKSRKGNSPA